MHSVIIALFLTLAAFAQEPSAYYNTQQDSVAVEYAKKVERYTESAEHLSKAGTGLFIGGGALIVLATAEVIHYTVKTEKNSEDYDVVEGDHGALGLIVLAGVGRILDGTIFKVSSYKKKWRKSPKLRNYEDFSCKHDLSVVNLYTGNYPQLYLFGVY